MDIFDVLFALYSMLFTAVMLCLFGTICACAYVIGTIIAVTCGAPPVLFGSIAAITIGFWLLWDRATA